MRKAASTWFSLVIVLVCLLQAGCEGRVGGSSSGEGQRGGAPDTAASPPGRVAIGRVIAESDLRSVGNSNVHARAVFKKVGNASVQVELVVRDLPTEDPNALYYAQLHEGSCSDEGTGKEHKEAEHETSYFGPPLALVRSDHVLTKSAGLQAHSDHENGIPEVPPGSIEQPVTFIASADGTASAMSLLQGVKPKRLTSGTSEYIHLHAATSSEGAPEKELACGDLIGAGRRAVNRS